MVNFYFLIDLTLLFFIIYLSFYSYKKKIYIKLFEYIKIFIIISISAKFASFTGISLQKLNIFSADTYTTLILIGFGLNFITILYLFKIFLRYSNKYIDNKKIKTFFAKSFTLIEIIILTTFTLYILMQLSLSKTYIYPTMKKSYSYPYIKLFYIKFLNDDFVNLLLNNDTKTNHKEVIFKSLKNSF